MFETVQMEDGEREPGFEFLEETGDILTQPIVNRQIRIDTQSDGFGDILT